ncbi:UbiA family prenyltransferase [Elusimicrobiota bacterium]
MKSIATFLKVRYREILIWLMPVFAGTIISSVQLEQIFSQRSFIFLLGSIFLVTHVIIFNDWGEFTKHNNISPEENKILFAASGSFLIASLLMFALIGFRVVAIAVFAASFSVLYSHPRIYLRSSAFAGSFIHLGAGTVLFMIGYYLNGIFNPTSLLTGFLFGLLLTAGHLIHQIIDIKEDKARNTLTAAIKFGKNRVYMASFAIFTLAAGYSLILFIILPDSPMLFFLTSAAYPPHAFCFLKCLKGNLNDSDIKTYQSEYRAIYLIAGTVWLIFWIATKVSA